MAIAQLFFPKENKIGTVELDVIVSESTTTNSRITKNPIESGADVNDHIISDPMSFSMQGVVSDSISSVAGAIGQLNTLQAVTSLFTKTNSASREAWEALLLLQALKQPFKLVTNLKIYPSVAIESLSTTQDKDTSNALFFVASMVQLNFVGELSLTPAQFNDGDTSDMMLPTITGGLKSLGSL